VIAALYVARGGCYYGLDGVDPWGEDRDARDYSGTDPVVAHPPCARWGRYWFGGPTAKDRSKYKLGDDGGCFEAALFAVRAWGGVLEHPEASHAWKHFGLAIPPRAGGWIEADNLGGWTCCVEQGHYGHKARKATWLYAQWCDLPELIWGPSEAIGKLDQGFHSAKERARARGRNWFSVTDRLNPRERKATPIPFRNVLIGMAESVWRK
jgi:hypothetical protein